MTANTNANKAGRITRQDLVAMKANADVKPNAIALLKKLAENTVSESVGYLSELAQMTARKPESCKIDAHVLEIGESGQAKCAQCGCEIKSLHQVTKKSIQSVKKQSDEQSIEDWVNASLKQRRMHFISVR